MGFLERKIEGRKTLQIPLSMKITTIGVIFNLKEFYQGVNMTSHN